MISLNKTYFVEMLRINNSGFFIARKKVKHFETRFLRGTRRRKESCLHSVHDDDSVWFEVQNFLYFKLVRKKGAFYFYKGLLYFRV